MGLLDGFMPQQNPYGANDDQQKAALLTGLLSAGFGALTGRRGAPLNSIGRAGLLGLGGYSGALDSATNQNMRMAQLEEQKQTGLLSRQNMEAQMAERAAKLARERGVQETIAGLQPPRTMLAGPMPDGMTMPPVQGQISPDMIAAALLQKGYAEEAGKFADVAGKLAPKTQVIDGKVYQVGPDGLKDLGGPGEFKAPPMRTIKSGNREIQQELQRDGTWKEVGNAPLWKPEEGQKPQRQYDADRGGWVSSDGSFTPIIGLDGKPVGPKADNKPPTEAQGKAALFGTRASEAHKTLNDLETKINTTGLALKNSLENVPGIGGALGVAGNSMLSGSQQKVEQAQRNFVNAVLRTESGAVISPQEFENAKKQYFPQPGDGPEVIKQKRENRMTAINGLKTMAGNSGSGIDTGPMVPKDAQLGDLDSLVNKYRTKR